MYSFISLLYTFRTFVAHHQENILFNIFIYFSSLHVSGIHVPIVRRKFCLIYLFISPLYIFLAFMCPSSGENCSICTKLVFVTLYGCRLLCRLDLKSNQQNRRHPYRVTNTSFVQIEQFSPDDGHMNTRNM